MCGFVPRFVRGAFRDVPCRRPGLETRLAGLRFTSGDATSRLASAIACAPHTSHSLRSEQTPSTRSGFTVEKHDTGTDCPTRVPPFFSMFRLLLRIGILAVMILALAIPKVDARATSANAAALASPRRALLSARPPRNERRSLIEVATQGLFDIFGFEVGGRCRRAARPRSGSC